MSSHLDEGTFQQVLDEELSAADREIAERHLAGCPECRAELHALERSFAAVAEGVSLLAPPDVSLDLAHATWRRRRVVGGWGVHVRRHLPRAALFLLAVAGVASATLPQSPLRHWIETRWQSPSAGRMEAVGDAVPSENHAGEAVSAGMSVDPLDGDLRVVVERSSPELWIRVRLADQPRMSVRGVGGAAGAQFRIGRGRISVEEAGAGELEVVIPRAARRVSISVDGRQFLLKEGEEVHVLVPADSIGPEIIFPGGS